MRSASSFYVLALCASFAAASACEHKDACGDAECSSNVLARLHVDLSPEAIVETTVRACRNDACNEFKPQLRPVNPGETLEIAPIKGVLPVRLTLTLPEGGGYLVEGLFTVDERQIGTSDSYELQVLDGAGAEVTAVKRPAQYKETTPNGRDCPPICRNAVIE
jgi:hypothetical protein